MRCAQATAHSSSTITPSITPLARARLLSSASCTREWIRDGICNEWACLDSNQGPRDYEFPSPIYKSAEIFTFVVDTCSLMLGPALNRSVTAVRSSGDQ